jgi:hypothetical protein
MKKSRKTFYAQIERGSFRTASGIEERFPPTRLSAGCGFRKETIAGMPATGEMRRNRPFGR